MKKRSGRRINEEESNLDYDPFEEVNGVENAVELNDGPHHHFDPMASELMSRILDTVCAYWTEMRATQSPLLSNSHR